MAIPIARILLTYLYKKLIILSDKKSSWFEVMESKPNEENSIENIDKTGIFTMQKVRISKYAKTSLRKEV